MIFLTSLNLTFYYSLKEIIFKGLLLVNKSTKYSVIFRVYSKRVLLRVVMNEIFLGRGASI